MARGSSKRTAAPQVVAHRASPTTGCGEAWLSTADICHRYGITEQTWRKTWPSWPVLAGSVRRFRSTPESGGKRRWPESAVQAWWETSSR